MFLHYYVQYVCLKLLSINISQYFFTIICLSSSPPSDRPGQGKGVAEGGGHEAAQVERRTRRRRPAPRRPVHLRARQVQAEV